MKQHHFLLALLGIMIAGYAGMAFLFADGDIAHYALARRVVYISTFTALVSAYIYFVRYKDFKWSWAIAIIANYTYLAWVLYDLAGCGWLRHQLTTITWLLSMSAVCWYWYKLVEWDEYRVKVALLFMASIPFAELLRYLFLLWLNYPNHIILHPLWFELMCVVLFLCWFFLYCAWFFIKRPMDEFDPRGKYIIYYRPRTKWHWLALVWHLGGHAIFYDGSRDGGVVVKFSAIANQRDFETGKWTDKKRALVISNNQAQVIAKSECSILARKRVSENFPYEHLAGMPYKTLACNCFDLLTYLVSKRKRLQNKYFKRWHDKYYYGASV